MKKNTFMFSTFPSFVHLRVGDTFGQNGPNKEFMLQNVLAYRPTEYKTGVLITICF